MTQLRFPTLDNQEKLEGIVGTDSEIINSLTYELDEIISKSGTISLQQLIHELEEFQYNANTLLHNIRIDRSREHKIDDPILNTFIEFMNSYQILVRFIKQNLEN